MKGLMVFIIITVLFCALSFPLKARDPVFSRESSEIISILIPVFFLTLIVIAFEFRTRTLRRNNRILREKEIIAIEVLEQRNLLSRRTKNIEDSLKYAHRIQNAMFTTVREVYRLFPESFVLHKPKDIVSGDFYWAKEIDGKIFISVADCTGHGVPGAFMSLIGLESFRQIILERSIYNPAEILSEMNTYFNKIFENLEELSLKDGMDLSLCSIQKNIMQLEFSGAFHSIYIIRNSEIIEIKGDKIILGPDNGFMRQSFTNQIIDLQEDDVIYLFSDGYADQFGGPEGKKYKYRRFRHLLLTIHKLPMHHQKKILEDNIQQWKGNLDQVDDIMVLGVRLLNSSSY